MRTPAFLSRVAHSDHGSKSVSPTPSWYGNPRRPSPKKPASMSGVAQSPWGNSGKFRGHHTRKFRGHHTKFLSLLEGRPVDRCATSPSPCVHASRRTGESHPFIAFCFAFLPAVGRACQLVGVLRECAGTRRNGGCRGNVRWGGPAAYQKWRLANAQPDPVLR